MDINYIFVKLWLFCLCQHYTAHSDCGNISGLWYFGRRLNQRPQFYEWLNYGHKSNLPFCERKILKLHIVNLSEIEQGFFIFQRSEIHWKIVLKKRQLLKYSIDKNMMWNTRQVPTRTTFCKGNVICRLFQEFYTKSTTALLRGPAPVARNTASSGRSVTERIYTSVKILRSIWNKTVLQIG